ncbi:hypothetical protein DHX103_09460 [Planococcus sp. X10-3]|uniref:hypothetical protein n=1 Tax=Planococcus sp. X10-3 TaxID=3061240 RepID=UPI003BB0044E
MKNKVILGISIFLLILVVVVVLLNTDKNLAELDEIPDEELILSANVTSTEHYTQEESYLYALSDDELGELFQIFSDQEVNRSFFNNSTSAEYFLNLQTAEELHLIKISNDKLYMQNGNNFYELKSGELYSFIATLNQ